MNLALKAKKHDKALRRLLIAGGLFSWVSVFNSCQPAAYSALGLQEEQFPQRAITQQNEITSALQPMARGTDSITILDASPQTSPLSQAPNSYPAALLSPDLLAARESLFDTHNDKFDQLNQVMDAAKQAYVPKALPLLTSQQPAFLVYVPDQGKRVLSYFQRSGNNTQTIRNGATVKPIFLRHLPSDIASITQIDQKKELYFQIILPLLIQTNLQIEQERSELLAIIHEREQQGMSFEGKTIADIEHPRLRDLAEKYDVMDQGIDELLLRVQTIPVDLMLAQSIEESGWATSRLSLQGNALFGERIWGQDSDGLVPHKRGQGETFKVKAFESLQDSVDSYANNLNRHFAYAQFRAKREQLRASGEQITGLKMLNTLSAYSTRRHAYLKNIKDIILDNKLDDFLNIKFCDCDDKLHIDVQRHVKVAQLYFDKKA